MRLIDADALWMVTEGEHDYYERFEIDQAPTVDAVPIIRCRYCKYYETTNPKSSRYGCCCRLHHIFPMQEDGFCSWAERKGK